MGNCCFRDKSTEAGFKKFNYNKIPGEKSLENYSNKDNRLDEILRAEEELRKSLIEEKITNNPPVLSKETEEEEEVYEDPNRKSEGTQSEKKTEKEPLVRFNTPESIMTHRSSDSRKRASSLKKHKKKEVKETHEVVREKKEGGEKKINQYEILKSLGEGTFGKVKLAIKRWGSFEQKYACKIYLKSKLKRKREMKRDKEGRVYYKDALQDVMKEIAVMKKLDHPNVIRLHEVLDDDEKDKLYMMLDFAAGGQLIEWDEDENIYFFTNSERQDDLTEKELRKIFRECIKGLSYLHANGIIHRDIKPQNILFEENGSASISGAKLADFGQSQIFEGDDKLNSTEGTYYFISPEACERSAGYEGFSGKAADIWALGITFFGFTFRRTPFTGSELPELFENIKTKEVEFPEDLRPISEPLKHLFRRMLEKDPTKRITIKELGSDEWLNIDEETPLADEIEEIQSINVTDAEIEECVIPLNRVFFLKAVAKKFKGSLKDADRKTSLNEDIRQESLTVPIDQSRNLQAINIETELRKSPRSPRSPVDVNFTKKTEI